MQVFFEKIFKNFYIIDFASEITAFPGILSSSACRSSIFHVNCGRQNCYFIMNRSYNLSFFTVYLISGFLSKVFFRKITPENPSAKSDLKSVYLPEVPIPPFFP